MPVSNLAKLEDQRLQLVRFIEHYRPQGSLNNNVTIVFDGVSDIYGGMSSSTVKVIFSRGESADDAIRTIVSNTKNTKNIVVVSDDRDIQYAVGALGAKVRTVQAFLKNSLPSKNKKVAAGKNTIRTNKDSSVPLKYISKTDKYKITSELSEIWLKSGKKRND